MFVSLQHLSFLRAPERLDDRRRFWTLLDWVTEKPNIREDLVQTGWKSWEEKWRDKAFKNRFQKDKRTVQISLKGKHASL